MAFPSLRIVGHGCRDSWKKTSSNHCPQPFNIINMVVEVEKNDGARPGPRQVADALCILLGYLQDIMVAHVSSNLTELAWQVKCEAVVGRSACSALKELEDVVYHDGLCRFVAKKCIKESVDSGGAFCVMEEYPGPHLDSIYIS